MQWYRAESDESRTRKARRLAKLLRLTRRDALGLVHLFYEAVARDFEDGNVSDLTEDELREVCEFNVQGCLYEAETESVLSAMISAGYIQVMKPRGKKRMVVSGWKERNGKVLRDRARKRTVRDLSADCPRTVRGPSADRPRYERTNVRTEDPPYIPPPAGGGRGLKSKGKKRRKAGYVNPPPEAYLDGNGQPGKEPGSCGE